MKKIITTGCFVFVSFLAFQCNDSATGNSGKDTTATDTGAHKIITEGGLKDSLSTGATDTTKQKDTSKR